MPHLDAFAVPLKKVKNVGLTEMCKNNGSKISVNEPGTREGFLIFVCLFLVLNTDYLKRQNL